MCTVDALIDDLPLDVADPTFETVDAYLAARWVGADGRAPRDAASLRDWFNRRVLAAVYEEHGRTVSRFRLVREYEALTGEWSLERNDLERDLAADGLDADALADRFVSADAMREHLESCLDARRETRPPVAAWRREEVGTAKRLAASKVRSVLSGLAASEALAGADGANVEVEVDLSCPDCGTRVPVEEAMDRGVVCPHHATDAAPDEERDEAASGPTVSSVFAMVSAASTLAVLPLLDDVTAFALDAAAAGVV